MTQLYRLLGRNIAHFRRQANLTQEELAEKTDYSVDFISLVERGINAPTVARLNDIAAAVGVEIWRLFFPTLKPTENQNWVSMGNREPKELAGNSVKPDPK